MSSTASSATRSRSIRAARNNEAAKLPEFSESLPMLLMRSREAVMRYFRPSLRAHGLTEQQWRVLRALVYAGPCEPTALARLTFLHAPSLSRIARALQQRGLIARSAADGDRRRSIISISIRGLKLMETVVPDSRAGYALIRRRFGEKRLQALQRMLQQLETSLLLELPEEGRAKEEH